MPPDIYLHVVGIIAIIWSLMLTGALWGSYQLGLKPTILPSFFLPFFVSIAYIVYLILKD